MPVIAGVFPFESARNAEFMANEVPGVRVPEALLERMRRADGPEAAAAEGIAIAREIARGAAARGRAGHPGVDRLGRRRRRPGRPRWTSLTDQMYSRWLRTWMAVIRAELRTARRARRDRRVRRRDPRACRSPSSKTTSSRASTRSIASVYDFTFGPTLHPGRVAGHPADGHQARRPRARGRRRHRHQRRAVSARLRGHRHRPLGLDAREGARARSRARASATSGCSRWTPPT